MQDLSNPSRRDPVRRMLVTVLFSAIAALLAMAIAFGHPHVRAEASPAPTFGLVAPAWSESSTAARSDASMPDAADALRLAPTSTAEPAATF